MNIKTLVLVQHSRIFKKISILHMQSYLEYFALSWRVSFDNAGSLSVGFNVAARSLQNQNLPAINN